MNKINSNKILLCVLISICAIFSVRVQRVEAKDHVVHYSDHPTSRKSGKFKVAVNGRSVFVERLSVEEGDLRYKFPGWEALSYHCGRSVSGRHYILSHRHIQNRLAAACFPSAEVAQVKVFG